MFPPEFFRAALIGIVQQAHFFLLLLQYSVPIVPRKDKFSGGLSSLSDVQALWMH